MKSLYAVIVSISILYSQALVMAEDLKLYYDEKTKQVFMENGPGRKELLMPIPVGQKVNPQAGVQTQTSVIAVETPVAAVPKPAPASHWFDKLSVRGYTQFRTTITGDDDAVKLYHPADRSAAPDQSFIIRRGRLILSGDVSDHLYVYIQPDMNAAPSDGDFSTQLRDMYGDIALDEKKEFRLRIGQSKVPFGFVNMQSSQNRLTMERADALNSAVEGERDVGAFFYWAPSEIRARFASLIKDGLKGSGDYGVVALGAYNGQGLNRGDQNDNLYGVARVSYPFMFDNGQFFEPGLQVYQGNFVPRVKELTLNKDEEPFEPEFDSGGISDKRIGISAIVYPQPFGLEFEWNFGKGPELSEDFKTIEEKSLQGGYVLANYKIDSSAGAIYPFTRWQYFDGGRKFGRNAPHAHVNEFDLGIEYSPWKDVELTAMYTYSKRRTNTNDFPYGDLEDESRVALQVQMNY